MKCHEFADRLDAILDDRQVPQADGLLLNHARVCANCRSLLAGQATLFAGFDSFECPPLRRDFVNQVLAAAAIEPGLEIESNSYVTKAIAKDDSAVNQRWTIAKFAAILAVSAAALFVVSLFLKNQFGTGTRPEIAVKVRTPQNKRLPSGPLLSTVNPGRRMAKQAAAPVAVIAHEELLSPTRVREYREALHLLALQLPEAVGQFESVEYYAPGIRPVRASFSVAIDALYRAIPGNRDHRVGIPQAGAALLSFDGLA